MKMFMLLAFLCIGFLLLAKIAGDHAGDVVFVITTVLFAVFFILMVSVGITILVNYFLSGTVLAKYQARRSALVYQLENLNYSDQVATELLYEQIISFNEDVLTGKVMVYNPWLQWAVSGDYQYIDLIEYSNKGDSASK
jgi:hypothetical protein